MKWWPHRSLRTKRSVARSTAATGAVLFLLLGFVAGTKADDYALFNAVFKTVGESDQQLPKNLDYSSVENVYDFLRQSYDGPLNQDQLLNGLKKGLAEASQDPYTTYLSADQAKQFNEDLNGTFSGIGAEIGKEGEFIIIVAPLSGYPAEKAGLRTQDVVFEIDGEQTAGYSIEEAVFKIRGEKGTSVELTILRGGEKLQISIIRDDIVVPSVTYEVTADNLGIMRVSRFAEDTQQLSREAAQSFLDSGVDGVVLDLRNNSGGYLEAAVDLCGLWLNDRVVVEQKENDGQDVTDTLRSSQGAILDETPTVVLINEGSASASEIVAGAMQDYETATLIGVTSYGKGSVQALEELSDGGVLKVTIARWYTPLGKNIDQLGIVPDIIVEMSESDYLQQLDPQLDRAVSFLKLAS